MKHFLPLLFALLTTPLWSQTGNGVVLLTDASHTFTPTTVDSTTSFSFQLVNEVGVAQTVFFGALNAPFALEDNAPVEIPSLDTIDVTIHFTPAAIGSFADTLSFVGSVFGSAEIALEGDGIQVIMTWTPDTLNFTTTPIGQSDVQSIELASVGNGAATIANFEFSNSIFSVDSANTEFSVAEGGTGVLSIQFDPTGAGSFQETVTFETNDPNNQYVTIVLNATSISEVSGDVCNTTWTNADSPFTLVGDIQVAEGCTLTIEPGVTIQMNGFNINLDGELNCMGTAEAPIQFMGGNLNLGPGLATHLEYVSMVDNSGMLSNGPHVLLYYNNFESSAGAYDFDCFDYENNNFATGTTDQYASGCDDFYRWNNSSYSLQSNTGDHVLRYYSSSGRDSYIFLDEHPIAPQSGLYEFSFTYESDRYERDCFMTIDVWRNNQWTTLYKSPEDIEGNSAFTRFARATQFFEEGEEMQFRIKHNVGVAETYSDEMYTHIDEVRIEKLRDEVNVVEWNFDNNASNFESLASDWGSYGGEPRVSVSDGILRINSIETSVNFNTNGWATAPIIVPADGWYFIEMDNTLKSASYNTYNEWYYRSSNDGTWHFIMQNAKLYSTDEGPDPYDWRKERIHSYEYLTAGSRIDFYYNSYYWTTEGQVEWEGKNFRIYQLAESSSELIELTQTSALNSERNLALNNFTAPYITGESGCDSLTLDYTTAVSIESKQPSASVSGVDVSATSLTTTGTNTSLNLENSVLSTVTSAGGVLELTDCTVLDVSTTTQSGTPSTTGLLYYNNFESDINQYDFDCFDYDNNYFATGSSTGYGSGCAEFVRSSSSAWSNQSNENDYYMRFYSASGRDAYLYLAEAPLAPSDGTYEFSFTYESDRYERDCFMTIDVMDGDEWLTIYRSPTDIESNSSLTRLARGTHDFNEGESMNFRIKHHNGVASGDFDQMYTYIDEVRIEPQRYEVSVASWDFNLNQSNFNSLESQFGSYGGEPRVTVNNDILRLNAIENNINFNTTGWGNAPIIVPEDGWYYIEAENKLTTASWYTYNYWEYRSSDNTSWKRFIDNARQYGSDWGPELYDWRKEAIHSFEYLTAGSRIDFQFNSYYWTTEGQIDWEGRNFRIYKLSGAPELTGPANSLTANSCEFNSISYEIDGSLNLTNCTVSESDADGIFVNTENASLSLEHCHIKDNARDGVRFEANGLIALNNVTITDNSEDGISSDQANLQADYVTIANNGNEAWHSANSGPSSITNSIVCNNLGGSFSSNNVLTEYNYMGSYPQFQSDSYLLEMYSPCVDAAMPWHTDQYMPFGTGGLRADMGAYGGPNNAGWGGNPAPSGSAVISGVTDSPQDQGNLVGVAFDASAFDAADIPDNISHYAFWRHYDPTGQAISSLDEGNWEQIGEMPAQSFNGYAYQAATLGNTNDTGPFSSCFTVVAHTDDPDTYWYSNVMCGESVDNLAPGAPDLNGMPLEEGGALISWADPAIEDYGYTRIVSDSGFEAEISADTLVVDAGALAGSTVTYTATHFDINGNESEPTDLTLVLGSAFDVIPLNAGWNLISLDRAPDDASIATLFGDLIEDNLLYVTGFDNGVTFHDPNGLSFLNTLSSLTPGYGYWVKVAQDDTLRAPGAPLGGGYLPTLDAGWNLIAYTADAPLAPEAFFVDLIADGDLAYLTGFDNGVQVFDPNGLPFLNTLTTLNNGYGYWLKTSADYAGMGLVDDAKGANPNYVVLNGTSNLGAYAGQTVLVLDESGRQVAELPILEGGYLMTTAVYGGEAGDGLQPSAGLQLEFAGERIVLDNAWTGDMAHLKLDVDFPIGLSVFPNPATDRVDLRWNQAASGQVRAEVFDATGKQVLDTPMGRFLSGWQQASIAVDALAPGHYTLHLLVDGRSVHQTALQRAE